MSAARSPPSSAPSPPANAARSDQPRRSLYRAWPCKRRKSAPICPQEPISQAGGLPSTHGTRAALEPSALWLLPRLCPRRRSGRAPLSRRRRPPELPAIARTHGAPSRLDLSRVLPDGDALPPRDRNPARQPLVRRPSPERALRHGLQRETRSIRSRFLRALLDAGDRERGVPARSLRVCSAEPDTGGALPAASTTGPGRTAAMGPTPTRRRDATPRPVELLRDPRSPRPPRDPRAWSCLRGACPRRRRAAACA